MTDDIIILDEEALTADNPALIEQLLKRAEKAEEPGSKDRVIHKGDEDTPAPMVVSSISSAGYIWLFNTETGVPSRFNANMVPRKLRDKRPDGSNVWTVTRLAIKPKGDMLKCMLHPDNPERKHYDKMGLAVCTKSNIINPLELTEHMRKKHKREYAAIQHEKDELEKKEDKEFKKRLLGMAIEPRESIKIRRKRKE